MKNYSELLELLETAMLLSGENDARSAIMTIHPARRRHREPGLGRDAVAHVSALVRAVQGFSIVITDRQEGGGARN